MQDMVRAVRIISDDIDTLLGKLLAPRLQINTLGTLLRDKERVTVHPDLAVRMQSHREMLRQSPGKGRVADLVLEAQVASGVVVGRLVSQ